MTSLSCDGSSDGGNRRSSCSSRNGEAPSKRANFKNSNSNNSGYYKQNNVGGMSDEDFERGVNRIISKASKVVQKMMDGTSFDSDDSLDSEDDMPNLVGKSSDEEEQPMFRDGWHGDAKFRREAIDRGDVAHLGKDYEVYNNEGEMMDEYGKKHNPEHGPVGKMSGKSLEDRHGCGKKTKNKNPSCMLDAIEMSWEINNYIKLNVDDPSKNCHTTEIQSDERGHQWRLKIYPNGTKNDGNLSLFLDTPDLPFGWERTVCFSLTLINHFDDSKSVTKNVHRHVFKSQKNDLCNWGWGSFIDTKRIIQHGFLKSGMLKVKAAIMVESTSTKMDPTEVDVYLSYAAESGCVESVMACLAQGACVNSESEDKFTPLHYACNTTKEYLPVVKLLIQRNANVNILNKYGETALLKAAYRGHDKVVEELLQHDADTTPFSTAGLSALSAAVGQGHLLVANLLIKYEAPLDLPLTSPPLWEAIANKRWKCSMLLIESGCSVHAPPEAPNPSFLCAAAERGQIKLVEKLLSRGANIEEKDDRGLTPLLCAAKAGKEEAVLTLCEHNADTGVTDEKGDTSVAMLVDQELIECAYILTDKYKASITRCSRIRKRVQRAKLLITLKKRQVEMEQIKQNKLALQKKSENDDFFIAEGLLSDEDDNKKEDSSSKASKKAAKKRAKKKAQKEKKRLAKAKAEAESKRLEDERLEKKRLKKEEQRKRKEAEEEIKRKKKLADDQALMEKRRKQEEKDRLLLLRVEQEKKANESATKKKKKKKKSVMGVGPDMIGDSTIKQIPDAEKGLFMERDTEHEDNAIEENQEWDTVVTRRKAKKTKGSADSEAFLQRRLVMPITRNSITQQTPQHSRQQNSYRHSTERNVNSKNGGEDGGWETVNKSIKHTNKLPPTTYKQKQKQQPLAPCQTPQQIYADPSNTRYPQPSHPSQHSQISMRENLNKNSENDDSSKEPHFVQTRVDSRHGEVMGGINQEQQARTIDQKALVKQQDKTFIQPPSEKLHKKASDEFLAVSLSFLDLEEESNRVNSSKLLQSKHAAWGNKQTKESANISSDSNTHTHMAWNNDNDNNTISKENDAQVDKAKWVGNITQMPAQQQQQQQMMMMQPKVLLRPVRENIEETPSVAVLRDDKVREIIDTISQMDVAYRPVFARVLRRWITQANTFSNSFIQDFIWNPNSEQIIDPILPSQEVAEVASMIYRLLVSNFPSSPDQRILTAATTQFANYCSDQAQEIYKLKTWQAQNKMLTRKPWTDALLQMSFCDRGRFNLKPHEGGIVFGQTALIILRNALDDLCRIYHITNGQEGNVRICGRLYNMIQRYETVAPLLSIDNMPTTLTEKTMLCLHRCFGVTHECFATPLTRRLSSYCSYFPDTDKYFGSSGSFYDFFPSSGSFVCHLPSVDKYNLVIMYTHIANIMQSSKNALSFVVCVRHNPTFDCNRDIPGLGPYVQHAELLLHNQHMFEIGRRHKTYRHPSSRSATLDANDHPIGVQLWTSDYDTVIYWIQNALGAQNWPITKESVLQVRDSFTP
jgi:ankyrin repeat protein